MKHLPKPHINTKTNQVNSLSLTVVISGIEDFENKENLNFLISKNNKFENAYKNQRRKVRKDQQDDSYDFLKESKLDSNWGTNNFPGGETKTQNTQDYRKDNDLAIDDIDFNFSAEKAVQKFTRFDICTELEDKNKPSETDSYDIPDEFSRRYDKNIQMIGL